MYTNVTACPRTLGRALAALILVLTASLAGTAPAGAQRYLGCYKDASNRDLNGSLTKSTKQSVNACIAECARAGYKYAGLQHYQWCACGNSYGRYGRTNNCNTKCTGNPGQTCGGAFANSVYSTSGGGAAAPRQQQPAAKGYYARWAKVAGPGGAWSTKWTLYGPQFTRAYGRPVCYHGAACRRGGTSYCGYWRAGQRVLFWGYGYNRPPLTLVCQVR